MSIEYRELGYECEEGYLELVQPLGPAGQQDSGKQGLCFSF